MKKDCPRCSGSGKIDDPTIEGSAYRAARKARGISLRECAQLMGISAPYLVQLEAGARSWNEALRSSIEKNLETKKKIKASPKSVDKQNKRER